MDSRNCFANPSCRIRSWHKERDSADLPMMRNNFSVVSAEVNIDIGRRVARAILKIS